MSPASAFPSRSFCHDVVSPFGVHSRLDADKCISSQTLFSGCTPTPCLLVAPSICLFTADLCSLLSSAQMTDLVFDRVVHVPSLSESTISFSSQFVVVLHKTQNRNTCEAAYGLQPARNAHLRRTYALLTAACSPLISLSSLVGRFQVSI